MEAVHVAPVPPHALELEQAILGGLMIEQDAYGQVASFLEAEHFYNVYHQQIFKAVQEVQRKGLPVDILTVSNELKLRGRLEEIGGPWYISSLTNKVATAANIQYHARIVQEKFILRTLRNVGVRLSDVNDTDDVFDTLDWVNEQMGKLNSITTGADPSDAASILSRMVDNREMPLYITPDMGDLDRHFAMGPKQVTVIGARPAVGKTAFALNMAMNIARQGHGVMFISLEMSETELVARMASALTGIDSERITRNEINEEERERIAKAAAYNAAWIPRIVIEDRATFRAGQAFGLFEKAVKKYNCKVAILDYVQLVDAKEEGRYEKMTAVSIALKQAAKATGIRLIELSQLKRRDGAETNPVMDDLRESGQLEADADTIILLGREHGSQTLLAKVEKNKKGPVGSVDIVYNLITQSMGPMPAPAKFSVVTAHPDNRIDDGAF